MNVIRKYAEIIAWVFFGLAISFSFLQVSRTFREVNDSRKQTRRLICVSQLDQALTLRDLIDYAVAGNPNPKAQEVAKKFYDRIEIPPKICEGTNVNVSDFFKRDAPFTTTTTTTTSTSSTTLPTRTTLVSRSARAPHRSTTSTTSAPRPTATTTTTSTTTTTRPCLGRRVTGQCVVER